MKIGCKCRTRIATKQEEFMILNGFWAICTDCGTLIEEVSSGG